MIKEGTWEVIIVGAGMSGLTAGAYLLQSGINVLILEKSSETGGVVNSFEKDGFLFDTGPRAIGNAGILKPMLYNLGIELPMTRSIVSTGIRDRIIHYNKREDIKLFTESLKALFPESGKEIKKIDRLIKRYTRMANILNRVPNPFFRDLFKDLKFLFRKFLPIIPQFLTTVLRTSLFIKSADEVLSSISNNSSLNDMVSQHFFKGTPANFAFGYFENYMDYLYPLGGTKKLPESITEKILSLGGKIKRNSEVVMVDPAKKIVLDEEGNSYTYNYLIWCGDLLSLYRRVDYSTLSPKIRTRVLKEYSRYEKGEVAESVFTLFLAVDEKPEYFKAISHGHFIYTPETRGLGKVHRGELKELKGKFPKIKKDMLYSWLEEFLIYNSYEISIPVLKDPSLAPEKCTGIIVSFLIDGEVIRLIDELGWYNDFKERAASIMLRVLENSIYPGIKNKILFKKISTPKTIMSMFNSNNGGIVGWSMENRPLTPGSLFRVTSSVKTKIPSIYRAGQWSYTPSGVPTAILTGRIASQKIIKKLKSEKKL